MMQCVKRLQSKCEKRLTFFKWGGVKSPSENNIKKKVKYNEEIF